MTDAVPPTEYMLTTVDNPFNPFTQYEAWLGFDERAGYYTNGFLARVVQTSPALSEVDELLAIQQAIDQIIDENVNGLYKKVIEP